MIEKADPKLGQEIHKHLKKLGIETPILDGPDYFTDTDKKKIIENNFRNILEILGMDLTDDSIQETPKRYAKMFVDELFWGLDYNNFPKCTTIENKMNYNSMLIEKCKVNSVCEHHFVYWGSLHNPAELGTWIAYIPNKKVIGLSKLSRIVDYFGHRPQVQERHTEQVAASVKYILDTEDVAVVSKTQHFCVMTRGIEDNTGYTITSSLHGLFMNDPTVRNEFMSLVNR